MWIKFIPEAELGAGIRRLLRAPVPLGSQLAVAQGRPMTRESLVLAADHTSRQDALVALVVSVV